MTYSHTCEHCLPVLLCEQHLYGISCVAALFSMYASACAAMIHHSIIMHLTVQEAGMPPPPLRRLVRAGSSSSTDSQQPTAGSSQAPAPKSMAGACLVQAATPAAAAPATDELLKPRSQSQSQPGGKVRPMQSDLSAQYVGEYQEQPDEEDVDILEELHAVPPTDNTQQPAAGEAGVSAVAPEETAAAPGNAEAADNGAAEAEAPAPGAAGTPAVAGNATAGDAANPIPSSRSPGTCVLPYSDPVMSAACCSLAHPAMAAPLLT